jgi:hypothetical protein
MSSCEEFGFGSSVAGARRVPWRLLFAIRFGGPIAANSQVPMEQPRSRNQISRSRFAQEAGAPEGSRELGQDRHSDSSPNHCYMATWAMRRPAG